MRIVLLVLCCTSLFCFFAASSALAQEPPDTAAIPGEVDDCGFKPFVIEGETVGCILEYDCYSRPENRELNVAELSEKYCGVQPGEELAAIGVHYDANTLSERPLLMGLEKVSLKEDGKKYNIRFKISKAKE